MRLLLLSFIFVGCVASVKESITPRAEEIIAKGVLHLRDRNLPDADASFRAALEIEYTAEGFDGLGCVAFLTERFNEAEEYFKKARSISPDYTRALAHLALLEEVKGNREKAANYYNIALREDPDDVFTRNNYAAFLADGDRPESALHELRKAEALNPHVIVKKNREILEGL